MLETAKTIWVIVLLVIPYLGVFAYSPPKSKSSTS
jgi:hypothetical protein